MTNDAILKDLLKDFITRDLSISVLENKTQNFSFDELKSKFSTDNKNEIDFEIAIDDLEKSGLIKTGPVVIEHGFGDDGNLSLIDNKRENVSLTINGYQKAIGLVAGAKDPVIKYSIDKNGYGVLRIDNGEPVVFGKASTRPFKLLRILCNSFGKMLRVNEVLSELIGDEIETLRTPFDRIQKLKNAIKELQRDGKLDQLKLKIEINERSKGHIMINWQNYT